MDNCSLKKKHIRDQKDAHWLRVFLTLAEDAVDICCCFCICTEISCCFSLGRGRYERRGDEEMEARTFGDSVAQKAKQCSVRVK